MIQDNKWELCYDNDTDIAPWLGLNSDWEFKNNLISTAEKKNKIKEKHGSANDIVDVEACRTFCDQSAFCQYFFISKDGRCILYQACKARENSDINQIQEGLKIYGHIFERGTIMNVFVIVCQNITSHLILLKEKFLNFIFQLTCFNIACRVSALNMSMQMALEIV